MMDNAFYWFDYNEVVNDSPLEYSLHLVEGTNMKCLIDESCFLDDEKQRNIVANCIYMFLKKTPFYNKSKYWMFIFDDVHNDEHYEDYVVNIYKEYKKYPQTINSKIDLMLLNLSLCLKSISSSLEDKYMRTDFRIFLPEENGISSCLSNMRFLVDSGYFNDGIGRLTIKGWERVENVSRNYTENQLFIASQFKGFETTIKGIKEVVSETGFLPICMDDHQTNDYIMPEIFGLIERSRAIIGEISSNNSGVYFELGYAKGLKKEIILVCKEILNEKGERILPVHFDLAQVSIIFYKDVEDLKKKLAFRIKNTISLL